MKKIIFLLAIALISFSSFAQCTNPNIFPCNVTVGGSFTLSSGTVFNLNGQVIGPANGGTGSTSPGSSGQYMIWNSGSSTGQWTTIAPYLSQSDTISKVVTLTQLNTAQTAKLGVSANAVSATKLATARNINGVPFDGTSNITIASASTDYYNTVNVAGGAGQAVFYITSDKTSTGTALYTTIDAVFPIINDVTQNYTYGWAYNAGTKALTVSAKTNLTAVISLLTVVLGPTNVGNGVPVQILVKGH